MKEIGCSNAINFDGGGSSIFMLADQNGKPRVMNIPSDNILGFHKRRSLPLLLGVKIKPQTLQ